MEPREVDARVLEVCQEVLRIPDLEIADEHTAREIPNYDSLAHIEILIRCQRACGVAFSAIEAGQIANFGELKALVRRKLGVEATA